MRGGRCVEGIVWGFEKGVDLFARREGEGDLGGVLGFLEVERLEAVLEWRDGVWGHAEFAEA